LIEIFIENRQNKKRVSEAKLAGWIRKILKRMGWKKVSLSLALVTDSEIRRLHRQFMGIDSVTDVLAFPQKKPFLGDVVVSVETALRVGPYFGNRWDEELLLYVCHGILHLKGYRDSTARKKARMDKKQESILKEILGAKWRSKKRKPLF